MIGLLRAVPVWAWAVAAALAWGGIQHHRAKRAGETLRTAQAQAAQEEAKALRGTIAETERRLTAHQEIASAAQAKVEAVQRDAAAVRSMADRVRNAAAYAASAAASNPAAAGSCQAAERAAHLFAELFGAATQRAAELADLADQSRAAGQACEASYDALRKP